MLAALAGGVLAGVWPGPTLAVAVSLLVGIPLLVRVEWAVLAVVTAGVLDGWLDDLAPWASPALTCVLVVSWLIRRSWSRPPRRRVAPVLVAAGVFSLLLALTTVLHVETTSGLGLVAPYAALLALLVVVTDVVGTTDPGGAPTDALGRRPARLAPATLGRCYVWSCVLAGLGALFGLVTSPEHRLTGPADDGYQLAVLLLAAIPLAVGLRVASRRRRTYLVVLALLIFVVAATGSQGAILGLVVMLVVALLSQQLGLRTGGAIMVLVGTASALVLAVFPSLVDERVSLQEDSTAQDVSVLADVWRTAAAMTADSPLVGLGPGSFERFGSDYAGVDDEAGVTLNSAHNTYLEVSTELGVPAALALLALLGCGLVAASRRWSRTQDPFAAAVSAALVGVLVAVFFSTQVLTLPLWLLAGLGGAWGGAPGAVRQRRSAPPVSTQV